MKKEFLELGTLLTREEAKKVRGGATGQHCSNDNECPAGLACMSGICSSGDGICAASSTAMGPLEFCTNDAVLAMIFANSNGFWCCNCTEAINYCK